MNCQLQYRSRVEPRYRWGELGRYSEQCTFVVRYSTCCCAAQLAWLSKIQPQVFVWLQASHPSTAWTPCMNSCASPQWSINPPVPLHMPIRPVALVLLVLLLSVWTWMQSLFLV